MRVKISNYCNPWIVLRFYDFWMMKRYKINRFEVYEQKQPKDKIDNFIEKTEDVLQDFINKHINPFLERILRSGQYKSIRIDYWDTWNVDNTLALIALPLLKKFKEDKQGYPSKIDDEDVPEELRTKEEYLPEDGDPKGLIKWNWILNEMIWAFEQLNLDNWEEQFYSGDSDLQFVPTENGYSEIVPGPNDTFEVDWEGYKACSDRIDQGLLLFGKYYRCLWS